MADTDHLISRFMADKSRCQTRYYNTKCSTIARKRKLFINSCRSAWYAKTKQAIIPLYHDAIYLNKILIIFKIFIASKAIVHEVWSLNLCVITDLWIGRVQPPLNVPCVQTKRVLSVISFVNYLILPWQWHWGQDE